MFMNLVTSLISPSRRLPPPVYIALQILAAAPMALLYVHICKEAESTSSGLQAIGLVLIWVNFCIVANRVRDFGVSSLWLLPVFVLGTIIYLADLDPVMLGTDWATHELWSNRLDYAKKIFALLACAVAAYAMATPSDAKRNKFGMPFGQTDWTMTQQASTKGRAHGARFNGPARACGTLNRAGAADPPVRAVRASLNQGGHVRSFSRRG